MSALTIAESGRRATIRFYRGLCGYRKVAVGLGALVVVVGCFVAYGWWMAWTPRLVLRTPEGNYPLAFSADGSTIATTSANRGIILWDPRDGRKRSEIRSPDGRHWSWGKFSPDGRIFAAIWFLPSAPGGLRMVDLIDVATGQVRATIPPPPGSEFAIGFRDEGRTLRILSAVNLVRTFVDVDVATGQVGSPRAVSAPNPRTTLGALSDDAGTFAFVDGSTIGGSPPSFDRVITWDLDRGRQVSITPSPGPGGVIACLGLSADGKSLAIGRDLGPMEVWDVTTGRLEARHPIHRPSFRPYRIWFSPEGSKLASSGQFVRPGISVDTLSFLKQRLLGIANPMLYELVVVDLANGRILGRSTKGVAVAFSQDGRTLARSDDDSATKLHDLPGPP